MVLRTGRWCLRPAHEEVRDEGIGVPRPGPEGVGGGAHPKLVAPTDVIVQVDTTTICGTDLHILKGDVPAVTDGRILGHEGVGTIAEVGAAVNKLAVGDRVIISPYHLLRCLLILPSAVACSLPGRRRHVRDRLDLRAPHQRHSGRVRPRPIRRGLLHKLPAGVSDEAAVMLSDILPTGFEIGVRNGRVKPGDVVAVVGAGPVGLSAMMTAGLYGASRVIAIDLDDNRLDQARGLGATDGVNSGASWKRSDGDDRRPGRGRGD